jgi:plastocyanin domain-containing protein
MKRTKIIKILMVTVALFVVGVVASACSSAPKTQTFKLEIGEGEIVAHDEATEEEVVIGEFHRMEPDVLVVEKGTHVVIEVTNPRGAIHSVSFPDFGVATGDLTPRGGTATLEFDADEAGTFLYKCDTEHDHEENKCAPDHKRQKGYLLVLDR